MKTYQVFPMIVILCLVFNMKANTQMNFIQYPGSDLIDACKKSEIEEVKIILNSGTDVNFTDKKGNTALMIASEKGNIVIVKYLLSNGANTNLQNNKGKTAAELAQKKKNNEIVALIDFAEKYLYNNLSDILYNNSSNRLDNFKELIAKTDVGNGTFELLISALEIKWQKDNNFLPNNSTDKKFFQYWAGLSYIPTTYGNAWDSNYWKNMAIILGSFQHIALLYDVNSFEANYLRFNICKISVLCFCRKNYTEFSKITFKTVEEDALLAFSEDYDKVRGEASFGYFKGVATEIYPKYINPLIEITSKEGLKNEAICYNLEQLNTWVQIIKVDEILIDKIKSKYNNNENDKIKKLTIDLVDNYKKSKSIFRK